MAYIGSQPTVGNFQACDAITTSATTTFNLLVGGVAISPQSAQHCLVSLNGILQAPISSYTISGSTIIFAAALTTDDVIDFITVLGDVLDLGVPSDDTVGAAQIKADLISGTTALAAEPADTDEFLVSDAGVLKRLDYSLIKASPAIELITTTTISSGTATVDFTSLDTSTYKNFKVVISSAHPATDGARMYMRLITGTDTVRDETDYTYATSGHRQDNAALDGNSTGAAFIDLSPQDIGNGNTENASFIVYLHDPANTTFHKLINAISGLISSGAKSGHGATNARYGQVTAVTGMRFYFSSGNIDAGIFKLYGIK